MTNSNLYWPSGNKGINSGANTKISLHLYVLKISLRAHAKTLNWNETFSVNSVLWLNKNTDSWRQTWAVSNRDATDFSLWKKLDSVALLFLASICMYKHTQRQKSEKAGGQHLKSVIANHASSFLTHSWLTEEKQNNKILAWLHNQHFSQSSVIRWLQRSGTWTMFPEEDHTEGY